LGADHSIGIWQKNRQKSVDAFRPKYESSVPSKSGRV
jgi:hypothetical protein